MPIDPVLLDARIRHLEMLQSAIARMSENSARLKTWCVSISTALIAYAASVGKPEILLYSVPLFLVLAGLDAKYLRLEKAFRSKFDSVRRSDLSEQDNFSVSPSWSAGTDTVSILFSWSVGLFYIPILIILLVLSRLI